MHSRLNRRREPERAPAAGEGLREPLRASERALCDRLRPSTRVRAALEADCTLGDAEHG
jgi:hypothetical protein